MKATLQTPSEKSAGPKFPLLAKSNYDGAVVLFTSPESGTVLVSGCTSNPTPSGHYSKTWLNVFGSNWTILPPGSTVTLEQE